MCAWICVWMCVFGDSCWVCNHTWWVCGCILILWIHVLIGLRASPPCSVQLPGHVSVSLCDGSGPVSLGPPHSSHPGLQPPVWLHRQAAVQAALLWVMHTPVVKLHNCRLSSNDVLLRLLSGQDANVIFQEDPKKLNLWFACVAFELKENATYYNKNSNKIQINHR